MAKRANREGKQLTKRQIQQVKDDAMRQLIELENYKKINEERLAQIKESYEVVNKMRSDSAQALESLKKDYQELSTQPYVEDGILEDLNNKIKSIEIISTKAEDSCQTMQDMIESIEMQTQSMDYDINKVKEAVESADGVTRRQEANKIQDLCDDAVDRAKWLDDSNEKLESRFNDSHTIADNAVTQLDNQLGNASALTGEELQLCKAKVDAVANINESSNQMGEISNNMSSYLSAIKNELDISGKHLDLVKEEADKTKLSVDEILKNVKADSQEAQEANNRLQQSNQLVNDAQDSYDKINTMYQEANESMTRVNELSTQTSESAEFVKGIDKSSKITPLLDNVNNSLQEAKTIDKECQDKLNEAKNLNGNNAEREKNAKEQSDTSAVRAEQQQEKLAQAEDQKEHSPKIGDKLADKLGNLLDNKPLDLRHKKQEKKTTKLQHTIAQICGVSDKSVSTKKGMLANVVWCAAKFTVASVVFGPLVGGWLVAHYNNNEYFSKKEAKAFDFVNSFSWGDPFIKGPSADKGKGK